MKKDELITLWQIQSAPLAKEIKSAILTPTGRGNVFAARDYIKANAKIGTAIKQNPNFDFSKISTVKELSDLIDPATRFRLKYFTPCLAYRYDELKPDAQKAFFQDKNWVFTEKMNGARGWFIYYKGKSFLFSRNYSDVDCSVPEYWANIVQEPNFKPDEIVAFDCEIMFEAGILLQAELERFGVSTDSKLEAMCALMQMNTPDAREIQRKFKEEKGKDLVGLRLIHPIYFKGINYVERPLGEGMDVADELIDYCRKAGINVNPIKRCSGSKEEKEAFINSIIEVGGEGIVGHYRKGEYNTSENRSKTSFLKLKRSVGAQASGKGMGDTIDGWISGFKPGTVGTSNEGLVSAFEVSIYMITPSGESKKHIIAYIPNITREMQIEATIKNDDGTISLNPNFLNMVVECDGQAISRVSKRLTHPRLIRYRADKDKHSCIYTTEFIDSQIDANSNV